MTEDQQNYFICGFATACAELCRSGEDVHAQNLIEGAGYSLDHFIEAGVDDYDLDALKKAHIKGASKTATAP